ncbi:MAG: hypothetical protein ABIX28_15835 [Vicinamibacterales bacterium]
MDRRTARRLMVAAVLGGLVLRLAFGLLYWTGKPLTHDEQEYLSLARSLSAGQGFVYDDAVEIGTGQQFGRAPGYPLFLAMIGAGQPGVAEAPRGIKIAQALIGAAGVWLIGLIALQASGPRAGAVAAGIAAIYPPLLTLPAYVLSETLYSTVALGGVLLLQNAAAGRSRAPRLRMAGVGAVWGTAVLIRPATIVFLPLAMLWLGVRRKYALALTLGCAAGLVIAPWTVRNMRVYDRFVLVASEGGVTFWTGNHPLAIGEGDLAANPAIKLAELEFRRSHAGLTPEALEPRYYADAMAYIRSHPGWWLGLVARKAYYLVVPTGPSYALHSSRYRVASAVPYLLLLPFALAGARRISRVEHPPAALFLLACSAVLTCLIFFPQERFRIPVLDPMLIVCAAGLAGAHRS